MDATQLEFLTDLDSELEVAGKPASAPTTAASKRRSTGKKYWFAAVLAMASSLLVIGPSPAAASCSDFYYPDFIPRSHSKWCSIAQRQYIYLRTTHPGASTVCYTFHAYHWACSLSERYDLGEMQACHTY
jgi:hypothetical protein